MVEPLIKRSNISERSTYSDYEDVLRSDFLYACAYCGVTEKEFPDFEIDHYRPVASFLPEDKNIADKLVLSYLQ